MIYLVLWLTLLALNLVDFACTSHILDIGGAEANPIQLYMINTFGKIGILYAKLPLLLILGVLLFVSRNDKLSTITTALFVGLNLFYVGIIAWSVYIISVLQ